MTRLRRIADTVVTVLVHAGVLGWPDNDPITNRSRRVYRGNRASRGNEGSRDERKRVHP